jgi:hypothetical protein
MKNRYHSTQEIKADHFNIIIDKKIFSDSMIAKFLKTKRKFTVKAEDLKRSFTILDNKKTKVKKFSEIEKEKLPIEMKKSGFEVNFSNLDI